MQTFEVPSRQFSAEDEVILDKIYKEGNVYEIGCWTGRSTSVLAKRGYVTVVDTFKGSETTNLKDFAEVNNVRRIFEDNMISLGLFNRVSIIQDNSSNAVFDVKDESIDFLFIDGDHRYQFIKNDIDQWWPKIKNGGRMSGHDCDRPLKGCGFDVNDGLDVDTYNNIHCGVIKAVYETFPSVNLEGRIWWIDK